VSGRPVDLSSRVFRNARILIVDDEPVNVDLLRRLLERAGFSRIESTNDSRQALDLYVKFRPDLILLDLHMPHRDGLEVMDELNQIAEASYLPILMLTGDDTPEAKREALSRGAKDFLNKPFHSDEVLLRIGTLLETRFLYLQIQSQNQILEAKVRDRTRELEAAQIEIIERLARAAEFRDDNTGQHTERVGQMAALIARQIGLSDTQVSLIRRAAPLHDVGKIGIPDSVLLKLGKLTPEEFELVKTHTTIGARILSGSRFTILRLAEEIAYSHHERWDGSGYAGIKGADIPPDRRGRGRIRRAHPEASLQSGVDRYGSDRGNRTPARASIRSGARGRLPSRDRAARAERAGDVMMKLLIDSFQLPAASFQLPTLTELSSTRVEGYPRT
jgi:putative nucleotidyltransferase with HDIG domain